MPLHDPLLAKRKFESLLYRTPFLFHFQLPSTIFYTYVRIWKTQRFLHVNCFFVDHTKYICTYTFFWQSGGQERLNIYLLEKNDAVWFRVKTLRKNDDCLFKLWQNHVTKSKQSRKKCNFHNQLTISALKTATRTIASLLDGVIILPLSTGIHGSFPLFLTLEQLWNL